MSVDGAKFRQRARRRPVLFCMGYEVHELRDLLALARMLRGFAQEHSHDNCHELFLTTAVTLEARARFIAEAGDKTALEHDTAVHAPVNMLI